MASNPFKKIEAHSTKKLKTMPAEELIEEARKALEARKCSFDWHRDMQTAVFFHSKEQNDETKHEMHEAYEAGEYAERYYRILRDVFLQKHGFPLKSDKIGDISDPCIHVFAY